MPGVRRGLVTLVLAVSLLAGGPMTGVSAAGTTQTSDAIELDQVFSLTPDEPGSVSVEYRFAIPDRVVSLETSVPANATVTDAVGFDRENATSYAWDGVEDRPTLTFQLDVNQTVSRSGPESANGSYLAVDVGEWALFTRPDPTLDFQYTGRNRPAFDRSSIVDGEGASGEWLVYLGPQDTFTREAEGQTFQLVVPAAASMAEFPDEVLDSLARASDRLRVGDRDERVFVVAAPTEGVPWAVRGLQTGDADMWVRDVESLGDPTNVWVHEYVHTRQSFETAGDARWLDEGLPSYYATLFAFEHQSLTFDEFADRLARGNASAYENVTLSSPETWNGHADYEKGALVAGHLDRQLRQASGGDRTLQTVFARLNARDRVNHSQFLAEIEAAGDEQVRNLTAIDAGTNATVSMWNRSDHRAAFGQLPARMEYSLPASNFTGGYRISGPFRSVDTEPESPIELVRGETLAIDVRAHNDGDRWGSYDAALRLNGTRVTSETGRIGPNESTVVTLEHTFVLAGRYVASVGDESVPIHVREPAMATVTNLTVTPTEVRQGDRAVATITVHNPHDEPAEREVILTRDFREVAREVVSLDAGERERVSFDVSFPQAGSTRVSANGREVVDVAVSPVPIATETPSVNRTTSPPETPTETSEETGTGFGVVAAGVAVTGWALLARRWAS